MDEHAALRLICLGQIQNSLLHNLSFGMKWNLSKPLSKVSFAFKVLEAVNVNRFHIKVIKAVWSIILF